ncbi:transposase-like protein [Fusarium oxysporum f. sp. phaseoli]
MSETAIKGSLASSPSSSPPPPAFPRLGSRSKAIAKQYDTALTLASTANSSIDDLYKIIWGQRRFVIASLLDKRKSRGRRSWIGNHGWFLAELRKDNTSSGDIWCCRLCDNKGAPRFFNAQSTSSASAHLFKAHRITETFEAGSSGDPSVLGLQRNGSKKRPASSSLLLPRAKMARIRELSVGYIIDSNLPFTTFESTYLQELFRQLDSDLYAQEEVNTYKLAEESTAELEVIQNNATRWNSTYMMIERALVKQSELNSFIPELGLEADASKRVPIADILTSDDWKVLREVSHILEPVYNMTMRTQGWGISGGHGRLWEAMTGMEFVLEHLEDWKVLYEDETADPAAEEWYTTQGEEAGPAMSVTSTLSRPPTVGQIRERPSRQSRSALSTSQVKTSQRSGLS